MRALGLAILALALFAPSASAAVLRIEHEDCACDPSSGLEGSTILAVRAAPGELNRLSVVVQPGGAVIVRDEGAPLRGCRPAASGGRRCGPIEDLDVELGDGDDSVDLQGIGGSVDPGPGDDVVTVSGAGVYLYDSPGADRFETAADATGIVWYGRRTESVTVRMNGLADDGPAGEGDDLRGRIIAMTGGSGDDVLEAGADRAFLTGGAGNDTLVGGPAADDIKAGEGDDDVDARDGDDSIDPGPGRDTLRGGPGRDTASYDSLLGPATLRITDGPAAGDGDDLTDAIEDLVGGPFDDTLVGDAGPNVLSGGGGSDTIIGGAGDDQINALDYGFDRDVIEPGVGRDRLSASAGDRVRLVDGEEDRLMCKGAPRIAADAVDVLEACAPSVGMRLARGSRGTARVVRLVVRCDSPSAVDCTGRVVVLRRGRRVSTRSRFGPLAPGRRQVIRLRLLRGPLRIGRCLSAHAVTRRDDVASSTSSAVWLTFCN